MILTPQSVRMPDLAWRSFLAFCSARGLELKSVKAYHVGSWLDQHPGSRSTQRQHLAAGPIDKDETLRAFADSQTQLENCRE